MAKGAVVRGTPVRSVGAPNGYRQGSIPNMSGTTPKQFQGDQSGQPNARSGTPLTDRNGNPGDAKRVASTGRSGGIVLSECGLNMSDPSSNGNGVILDGINGAMLEPPNAAAMDSPVPSGAPHFPPAAMDAENRAHLGSGNERAAGPILGVGGVLSRGMVGTSTPTGSETELLEDDKLANLGAGGAY